MKEPDWIFDEHWIDWRIVPALTLGEAAYLLAGADPAEARNNRIPSSRVEALRTALEASVRTGDLVPFELWGFDFDGGLCPLNAGDLFYWEHRMGVWGSSALAEFDMACRCIPGYNSRELFSAFMGLPPEVARQGLFEAAVAAISPGLLEVPFDS